MKFRQITILIIATAWVVYFLTSLGNSVGTPITCREGFYDWLLVATGVLFIVVNMVIGAALVIVFTEKTNEED